MWSDIEWLEEGGDWEEPTTCYTENLLALKQQGAATEIALLYDLSFLNPCRSLFQMRHAIISPDFNWHYI
ncbi:uncharacterized protein MYCFIDRAFT_174400 [Pseudocercospora fijiensis CIRAD86]|uniref:Uncharacterized protein n=1 Tax=Pseudocercospora fijiensis (strain CIRAD86) TaxID=383855 RepID=M2ZV52_PSEFD|nr:uncharacterized protein MYCFIDRAFT_174400 [Pseudocercospora fijiensis CIRAD86]EME82884.1 hypothetical protein MYCFIDRAFT_174400 [Pseudocercospora fijiensis CIRAD86]